MFCRKCGKKILDDSVFCPGCGEKVMPEDRPESNSPKEEIAQEQAASLEKIQEEKPNEKVEEDDKKDTKAVAWFFVAVIGLFLLALICSVCCSERNATNADIESMHTDINLSSLGVDVVIVPKKNIDDLVVKLSFYDRNGALLETKTEQLGDVKKRQEIRITVSITDFSYSDILKLHQVEVNVVGGRV